MVTTSEVVERVLQLGMEARIRAGMVSSHYRRGNLTRLRRAWKAAAELSRIAADLAAAAFQVHDLLDAEIRTARYRWENE